MNEWEATASLFDGPKYMHFEVEQKFEVSGLAAIRRRLDGLGVSWDDSVFQVDRYYAHPVRDFGKTDEALRIRSVAEKNCVTYKGPKIDATTKTRREIELPLSDGRNAACQFAELLETLGFQTILAVSKGRQPGQIEWEGHVVHVALDTVEGLGVFVELEVNCEEDQVADARQTIGSLAHKLGLTRNQRMGYLELLLRINDKISVGEREQE